jgi:hypothetical protein
MCNCSGRTNQYDKSTYNGDKKLYSLNSSEFIQTHTLRRNDSSFIGDVYVKLANDSVFSELYVINYSDTLYSIKRHILTSKLGRDIQVYEKDFYGYMFIVKKNDYFILTYYRKNGTIPSDNITIEWNYDKNILEFQKVP